MYEEPWSDIRDYPERHRAALVAELKAELGVDHVLANRKFTMLAKREDQDDVLVMAGGEFYIIHLTWSGHTESAPYPRAEVFPSREILDAKLLEDGRWY